MKLDDLANRATLGTPGRVGPAFGRFMRAVGTPIVRFTHRATLDGVENLPKTGAFLLVANHSAGVALAEIASFAALYYAQVGDSRPIAGFAHPAMFHIWPGSALLRGVGAVPSSYASAERTLAAGIPLLIFPGGDHEAFRPVWHANTVDFGGRLGFLKIARKAGVPIVPMGIRGSHFTAPILWNSRTILPNLLILPRLLGVKRYPLSLLGALVTAAILTWLPASVPWRIFAAWCFLASVIPPMWPWIPWTIRLRIGAPIAPDELFSADASDDDLRTSLARVEREVAKLVAR